MLDREILDTLVALAREAGWIVRTAPPDSSPELLAPRSGICRVRGSSWIVLQDGDSCAERIRVVAEALRRKDGGVLEQHFLPPVVRALVED